MRWRIWHLLLLMGVIAGAINYTNNQSYDVLKVRVVSIGPTEAASSPLIGSLKGDFYMLLDLRHDETIDYELSAFVACNYGRHEFFPEPINASNLDDLRHQTIVLNYRRYKFLWVEPDKPHEIIESRFNQVIWFSY